MFENITSYIYNKTVQINNNKTLLNIYYLDLTRYQLEKLVVPFNKNPTMVHVHVLKYNTSIWLLNIIQYYISKY